MSPEHGTAAGTRPVSRSDRLMKNAFGIEVLVVGLAIACSLVFTSFPQRVSFQWEFEDGERNPITHTPRALRRGRSSSTTPGS